MYFKETKIKSPLNPQNPRILLSSAIGMVSLCDDYFA